MYNVLTKIVILVADRSIDFFENNMMTRAF